MAKSSDSQSFKQKEISQRMDSSEISGSQASRTSISSLKLCYMVGLIAISLLEFLPLICSQKSSTGQALSLGHDIQDGQHARSIRDTRPFPGVKNSSSDPFELSTDWLMMGANGGKTEDLIASEGRNSASFSEFGSAKNTSVRRSGYKKKNHKNSNKTLLDEEQSESSDSNEIFDDLEEIAGTQKEPECAAHNRYYCTYKENYPLKLVTEVTKYYRWPLEKLFRDLHAQIMPKLAQDSNGNLVCDSVTRVVRPGWARNTNDRWLVVINTENYHQYVTEVVCLYGSNSRCNFVPPCYYSSCQQRYNTQKLLVIDPMNPYRGPFLSEFLFPSCCVCYVPSTSEGLQDRYRPSPATMYQRTMQQEAATNLNPMSGYRPISLNNEEGQAASSSDQPIQTDRNARSPASPSSLPSLVSPQASSLTSARQQQQDPTAHQPLGPGEIRRAGEFFRVRESNDIGEVSKVSQMESVAGDDSEAKKS